MAASLFKSITSQDSPLDGSAAGAGVTKAAVSNFLTVQSLTNFAAMTGAITAAWNALRLVMPAAASLWTPYIFAIAWGLISLLMSIDGLKDASGKWQPGVVAAAVFVAIINSLVLASAVVGTKAVTGSGA